ncbi:MAG: tetratricopeptide repeat protein [Nitrospinae bacterium]|nr:tetratricopeptide repeat protein [Nitrospinota bacterium]
MLFTSIVTAAAILMLSTVTVSNAQGDTGDEWEKLHKETIELFRAEKYEQAVLTAKSALKLAEKNWGPNHLNVATSLNKLAEVYIIMEQYTLAEPLCKRAMEIREKALGPEHPDVAESLNTLAWFYESQEQYAQAEALYKRAVEIREKSLGPKHPDLAESLNNLALIYGYQGQYTQAEALFKRSLDIREKALGLNHTDVAESLMNLAILYKKQGLYTEAEPLYKRVLAIREKTLGPGHPAVARIRNSLIEMYVKMGRYKDAETLEKSASGAGKNDKDSINWAELSAGSATGSFAINGKGIELKHVYALSQPNFFEDSKKDIAVLLTKEPVPDETLKNIGRLQDVAQDLHEWVLFLIDENGKPIHEWIDHPSLGEIRLTSSGITYAKFIQKTFKEGIIEGAFITKEEEEFPTKHKYKINVQFKAAILQAKRPEPLPDAKTGQKLPADGGEPGKAYMDFLKAMQEKNIAVIRTMSPPKIAKKSDSELLMVVELLDGMTPKDLKITEGYIKGDAAVLYVTGTEDGEKQYGTIPLNKTGKHWIVGEQKWRNTPQDSKKKED